MPATATFVQPEARPLTPELLASVLASIPGTPRSLPRGAVRQHDNYSNDIAEVQLPDGRVLMVKRGRHEWAAAGFETTRVASRLLRMAGILAPAPLPLPDRLTDLQVAAYWRIDLPTLAEVWPDLSTAQREQAIRSWGALARGVHRVELPAFGGLTASGERHDGIWEFVKSDLRLRLRPAAEACWPAGAVLMDRMLDALRRVPRLEDRLPCLVHGDLHMDNVLCELRDGKVRCVGLLDLDNCTGGAAESDLARAEVLHGPLFGRHIEERWTGWLYQGYGAGLDPRALGFFRAYHLANLGFYSALVGHDVHAADVLVALAAEVEGLE